MGKVWELTRKYSHVSLAVPLQNEKKIRAFTFPKQKEEIEYIKKQTRRKKNLPDFFFTSFRNEKEKNIVKIIIIRLPSASG